ncbi:MAG: FAD-dependent oxidoreductase [Terracidiphilus sp.]
MVVAGAGIAGAAYALECVGRGLRTVVVESSGIGGGATGSESRQMNHPGSPEHTRLGIRCKAAARRSNERTQAENRSPGNDDSADSRHLVY